MSRKTKSEQAFEDYCTTVGVAWTRIEESDTKTPDYELEIDGRTVIAEVKEVDRNPEERESDRQREATGFGKELGRHTRPTCPQENRQRVEANQGADQRSLPWHSCANGGRGDGARMVLGSSPSGTLCHQNSNVRVAGSPVRSAQRPLDKSLFCRLEVRPQEKNDARYEHVDQRCCRPGADRDQHTSACFLPQSLRHCSDRARSDQPTPGSAARYGPSTDGLDHHRADAGMSSEEVA